MISEGERATFIRIISESRCPIIEKCIYLTDGSSPPYNRNAVYRYAAFCSMKTGIRRVTSLICSQGKKLRTVPVMMPERGEDPSPSSRFLVLGGFPL